MSRAKWSSIVSASILMISAIGIAESLSPFNLQGDIDYPEPLEERNYYATPIPMPSVNYGYWGINIGGLNIVDFNSSITQITSTTSTTNTPNDTRFNYLVGLFGGVATNIRHLYIAAELSGSYDFFNKTISTTFPDSATASITLKKPFTIGLDLLPGYLTEDRELLLYGRIGGGVNLFKFTPNGDDEASSHKIVSGWRAGAGIDYALTESFHVRLEYTFNWYGNLNKLYTPSDSSTTYSYSFARLRVHQINLGLLIQL